MTVGVAGAGKSTIANALRDRFLEINLDDCREAVNGNADDNSNIMQVIAYRDNLIDLAAMTGSDIIISDTNLHKQFRDQLLDKLKGLGYTVTILHVDTPIDKALEFNQSRERQVPEDVIKSMHETLTEQAEGDQFKHPAVSQVVRHNPLKDRLPPL